MKKSKLFVGSLPVNVKKRELSKFFSQFGTLKKIELVTHKNTNKGKGFAFVVFEEQETAQNLLTSKIRFRDRILTIRRHLKGSELKKYTKAFEERRMFVGSLPEATTKKELMDIFKTEGEIEKAYFINMNQKTTNFGYILFKYSITLEKCLQKTFVLHDSLIKCSRYRSKTDRKLLSNSTPLQISKPELKSNNNTSRRHLEQKINKIPLPLFPKLNSHQTDHKSLKKISKFANSVFMCSISAKKLRRINKNHNLCNLRFNPSKFEL